MVSASSMKSTSAARFFAMKSLRAVHMVNSEMPTAPLESNSGRAMPRSCGSSANGSTAETRSAFLSARIARMVGNGASITV